MEEAETDFGAVNHSPVVLHIDAALLPAADWVIGWIPFYVLYRLQIFMGHFLSQCNNISGVNAALVNQFDLLEGNRASKLSPDVSYLPGGDGAEDVDDTVRFLLTLLGILLAK